MLEDLKLFYKRLIRAGVHDKLSDHEKFRLKSINFLCLLCVFITLPYYIFFILQGSPQFSLVFSIFQLGFIALLYVNQKQYFNTARIMLVTITSVSVFTASIFFGFDSGFHLYLYTSPLFVFWLFSKEQKKLIIISLLIYCSTYILIFIHKIYYQPIFIISKTIIMLDLYSLNMIQNLLLMFLLFSNYTRYYRKINDSLILKQQKLEDEIQKRKTADEYSQKLIHDLNQSYKSLEQFSFIVSHNIRSPLSNIKGYLSLYDREHPEDPANDIIIENINSAANNLDSVLSDLNSILKSRKQGLENKESINLDMMINAIKQSLSGEIDSSRTTIIKSFEKSYNMHSVKTLLQSILMNLIQNAIKYRRDKVLPVIEIKAYRNGDTQYLSVKDNGIGIDLKKYGDRVFRLYERFNKEIQGKGIGLYLVKTHVEMMGGSIEIDSEPGKGTEFIIRLQDN